MPNMLRNVLAVIAGFVVGGIVNGALITISPMLVPPPAGVDVNDPDSLKQGIHLFEVRHFIMPFLAHALGTLTGALAAYLIAATHHSRVAFAVGVLFLLGGIAASFMIAAPAWYIGFDLVAAYLPMAWLAARIGSRLKNRNAAVLERAA